MADYRRLFTNIFMLNLYTCIQWYLLTLYQVNWWLNNNSDKILWSVIYRLTSICERSLSDIVTIRVMSSYQITFQSIVSCFWNLRWQNQTSVITHISNNKVVIIVPSTYRGLLLYIYLFYNHGNILLILWPL